MTDPYSLIFCLVTLHVSAVCADLWKRDEETVLFELKSKAVRLHQLIVATHVEAEEKIRIKKRHRAYKTESVQRTSACANTIIKTRIYRIFPLLPITRIDARDALLFFLIFSFPVDFIRRHATFHKRWRSTRVPCIDAHALWKRNSFFWRVRPQKWVTSDPYMTFLTHKAPYFRKFNTIFTDFEYSEKTRFNQCPAIIGLGLQSWFGKPRFFRF